MEYSSVEVNYPFGNHVSIPVRLVTDGFDGPMYRIDITAEALEDLVRIINEKGLGMVSASLVGK